VTVRLGVAAGEASGDQLAAAIVSALGERLPGLEAAGIVGPALERCGVAPLARLDDLEVMGLFEVAGHVPRLMRLRAGVVEAFAARGIDMFVGVDAPDFNLGLARRMRRRGVRTVQVVAPSVWAWRRYRIARIARSLDLLLTLFPFEPALFEGRDVEVHFIGHPLADAMPRCPDRAGACRGLGLDPEIRRVALLPGSRPGEIARHAALVCATADRLRHAAGLRGLLLLADAADLERFAHAAGRAPEAMDMDIRLGATRAGLTAADLALSASGTVTLEALLARTPMTVFYRLPLATWAAARGLRLVRSRWISLPNVLAGESLVPERIQHQATPEQLAADLLAWQDDPARRRHFATRAAEVHDRLARGAAERAAALIARYWPEAGRCT